MMRASVVSGLKPHHKLFFKMKLVATDFNVISTMKKISPVHLIVYNRDQFSSAEQQTSGTVVQRCSVRKGVLIL